MNLPKRYEETLLLRTCDCDLYGLWRPGAILETMQETAGSSCYALGIGMEALREMNLAWVVSSTRVEFTRLPAIGERIRVETYPTPPRHMFFPRSHLFTDASGEVIGRANSLWVTLDISARKAVRSDEVLSRIPDNRDLPLALPLPAPVRLSEGAQPTRVEYLPQYTDFDVNGHVNNTRYMDWCMNALGLPLLRERAVTAFTVHYDSEVLPETRVQTLCSANQEGFVFQGEAEGKRCFAIGGKLTERAK